MRLTATRSDKAESAREKNYSTIQEKVNQFFFFQHFLFLPQPAGAVEYTDCFSAEG